MAEQLAENYHNTWGRKKKMELQTKGLHMFLSSCRIRSYPSVLLVIVRVTLSSNCILSVEKLETESVKNRATEGHSDAVTPCDNVKWPFTDLQRT